MVVTRREFLGRSAAVAAATTMGLSWARQSFAQDTADIRLALIGVRGQGKNHLKASQDNFVALCDVDESVLAEWKAKIKNDTGRTVDTYTDYRKLLENKDIDGVSIATPNHTHALITVAAAQAGKHVYVEKPASHNIWEGRQMIEAARQNNRVVQCGTQSRSSGSLQEAVKWVQDGGLGKILYAVGTCYKPRPSIGKLDSPLVIPSSIDYDLWCGPAEKRELYRPMLHYDWHWDLNTGNGDLGNQGVHQVDIARWFLGEEQAPPQTLSIGGRLGYEDAGDTPNTQVVYYGYEKAPLIFEVRGLPRDTQAREEPGDWFPRMDKFRGSQIGVIVQCEKGHIFVPTYVEAIAYDLEGNEVKRWAHGMNPLQLHHHNWLAAVAKGNSSTLNADIPVTHVSTTLCNTAGISHRLGKPASAAAIMEQVKGNDLLSAAFDRMASHLRANDVDVDSEPGALTFGSWLEMDPSTEMFAGNDAANELRSRKQRGEFAVPDLERDGAAKTAAAS